MKTNKAKVVFKALTTSFSFLLAVLLTGNAIINENAQTINGFLNETRDYVYSDIYFEGNKVLIRYAVNEENLFENILNSTNKSVECDFMKELLKCFERTCLINYAKLCAEIDKKRTEKKDIEALAIKIDYYYSLIII